MNEIEIFKNEELGEVRTILNEDGSICVNAEDTAKGFGWYQIKNNKKYTRWETINNYLSEFGFSQLVGKDDFIPESLFYMLGMKANNKTALKFQKWLANDVIPTIRKHGMYITNELLQDKEKLEEEIKSLREEMYLKDDKIEELEKVRKEYMIQRGNLFNISIKTGINSPYIPDLTLQVIRNFIKDNPKQLLNVDDNNHTLKVRPLIKELKKLIMRRNDIIYIITLLGMRIENNNVIISNKLLDDNYTPIQEIYI